LIYGPEYESVAKFFMKSTPKQNLKESSDSQLVKMNFSDIDLARQLFGEHNHNLQKVEEALDISINVRGNTVFIQGDSIVADLAQNILNQLYGLLKDDYPFHPNDVDYAIKVLSADDRIDLKNIFQDTVYITGKKSYITPKSPVQKEYIDAIRSYDIVFGIGPAGTGKTYLAMAMAVAALSKGIVSRIILTRPAVEAGESLGFLPGDLAEKVDPYLRPLYDALHDMMRFEKTSKLMQQGAIEVAPIAFMRGRTLNDSFIILDEAQNTTSEQMKMFLTRIGFNSKAVITGDITQIDLPGDKISGLIETKNILQGIDGIRFVFFSKTDVVRHRLVQTIIKAYEDLEASKNT
jgi:phosphate starvation-inducible PhoH-like protein